MFTLYKKDNAFGIAYNGKPFFRPASGKMGKREAEICVKSLNQFSFVGEPIFKDLSQQEIDDCIDYIMPVGNYKYPDASVASRGTERSFYDERLYGYQA